MLDFFGSSAVSLSLSLEDDGWPRLPEVFCLTFGIALILFCTTSTHTNMTLARLIIITIIIIIIIIILRTILMVLAS